jgi:probable F420-dependent oxidoreductase
MILAVRAYWHCWQNGAKLNFQGEFFKLDLMTPFFSPDPHTSPEIPIYVSAINRQMLRMAGEVADGVHFHVLHTVRYLEEFALPTIGDGMGLSGRARNDLTLTGSVFVIPTDDPQYAATAETYVRSQLSFYMSTPAYQVVLDLHGWNHLSRKLGRLARRGRWSEMPLLITDDILDVFTVRGTWAELPGKIRQKYGTIFDRVSYYLPFVPGEADEGWRATIQGFKHLRR